MIISTGDTQNLWNSLILHNENVLIQYVGGRRPPPPFSVSIIRDGEVTQLKAWPIGTLRLPGKSLYGSELDV